MKKVVVSLSFIAVLLFSMNSAFSKPILIGGVRFYIAKWAITLGECQDGIGICAVVNFGSDNYIGYDNETDQGIIKISKKDQFAGQISHSELNIREDSPIDPKIIEKINEFKTNGKIVILKKGTYRAVEDANFYTFTVGYYLQ